MKEHRLIDRAKHHYLFHLVRVPGQDPVRYQGTEVRPTAREMQTYDKERKNFGF